MVFVTTMTIPTPVHPIPTCLRHSWVIRITLKHPMPMPNPLAPSQANSCLSNALPNLWPPCILLTHSWPDTPSTFPLPCVKSIPNTHTHFQPNTHLTFPLSCVKSIPNVSLASWLQLGEAWSHTSLAQYVLVCLSSLSIYLFLLLSAVCSSVSSFATLHSFLYVSSSVPCLCLPLFHLSLFYPFVNPTLVIPCFPYDPFPIIQINLILTTPCTCINTLVTSCCNPVW